jgi:uncharacterized LabA/DUF88 family protein
MRTRVYIDGFNLYYGCLKGTPYRWLDLTALCRACLPKNRIDLVRYFTARISPRPNDPNQAMRQQTYLRALATDPLVEVHLGHFLTHEVTMPDAAAWKLGKIQPVRVMKTEEKGSDVNLAAHLMMDAFDNLFDVAVIISNDSDLKEPISLVRNRFGKTIGILNPQAEFSRVLRPLAHFSKPIRSSALLRAQFPDALQDQFGTINKPENW